MLGRAGDEEGERWVSVPLTEQQMMPSGRSMDEVATEALMEFVWPGLEELAVGMIEAYRDGLIDPVETDEGVKWDLTGLGRQVVAGSDRQDKAILNAIKRTPPGHREEARENFDVLKLLK